MLLTCRKCLKTVTVLELSIFIQKVLWFKLLWFRKLLLIIQERVQRRNYDCALEGTQATLVSLVNISQAFIQGPPVEFYTKQMVHFQLEEFFT